MLWAQLSGKAPVDHGRSEDVLTSNVFGALRYVPLRAGVVAILSRAAGDHASELCAILADTDAVKDEF